MARTWAAKTVAGGDLLLVEAPPPAALHRGHRDGPHSRPAVGGQRTERDGEAEPDENGGARRDGGARPSARARPPVPARAFARPLTRSPGPPRRPRRRP